ncbi:hypothetical protein [Dictyobacter kobayashii]|uniref:HTH cro/C1-type domain-containing protein n=1 Tax=Dictyobacter kobayashii TaxID=2014872 RepID=A0A402APD1_9CHLR|nr:hypothetical protein [Dictyobacter kobayashii]GCE20889.1 hypothetical protein KDK_46890 [Dictyobacter kobayashii]
MDKHASKPTLLELRRNTTITSEQLAHESGVTLAQSYAVEIGGFVDEHVARTVMSTFSRLTHQHVTLNDIRWRHPVAWIPSSRRRAQ